jgi:hypothetical protein
MNVWTLRCERGRTDRVKDLGRDDSVLRLELSVAQLRVIGSPEAHRTKEGPAVTVTNPTLCVQS